jgi:hypothetical protein
LGDLREAGVWHVDPVVDNTPMDCTFQKCGKNTLDLFNGNGRFARRARTMSTAPDTDAVAVLSMMPKARPDGGCRHGVQLETERGP